MVPSLKFDCFWFFVFLAIAVEGVRASGNDQL